ncbi:UNVERIFIED_CONTAM: hypothetical protein HDU68_011233 [Siphonaria sp. JEL0065]|nr:hypothetical protein HDU68_011233 [Siphonaria sp. JEL0065]
MLPELLSQIVLRLPIDDKLAAIGLTCKRNSWILYDVEFARQHWKRRLPPGRSILVYTRSILKKVWRDLPIGYRVAFFAEFFSRPFSKERDMCWEFHYQRFGVLSDQEALRITKNLLALPSFHPRLNNQRMLQWACLYAPAKAVEIILASNRTQPVPVMGTCLLSVCKAERVDILALLLKDPRIDASSNNNELLRKVCHREFGCNNIAVIRLLVADPRVDASIAQLKLEELEGVINQ